jgi:cell division protease FtsH
VKNTFVRGAVVFIGVIAIVVVMSMFVSNLSPGGKGEMKDVEFPDFLAKIQNSTISRVDIMEDQGVLVGLNNDTGVTDQQFPKAYDFKVILPTGYADQINAAVASMKQDAALKAGKTITVDPKTISTLDWGFKVEYLPPAKESWLTVILPYVISLALIGGMWFLFMRQMQGNANKAMSFGKSRATMVEGNQRTVTFNDVAGADEEKEELAEIVEFLKNQQKFLELGARIPKGVLLVGPPGTGKTLLARAVSGEAGVPFFAISGSDFVELYVGVGASRVRDLFERAKRNSPCIVFIDEIDAVGRHRGAGMGGGHDEREQTLNQLLVEMDGFTVNEGIIILAATNRPDILDPALLRPGRFDRQVTVNYPDSKGREAILKVHSRGKPLAPDVNLEIIAKMTPFFTGADLENVMNESAILAARRGRKTITMSEITEAINRVSMGPEKKSKKVTEMDRKLVACHEAGHALVAFMLPGADPVQEVSIIPRGLAGGYTQMLPTEEFHYRTRTKLMGDLTVSMGGHVAERILLGDITSGSEGDLKHASDLARKMITEYGMSDELGPIYLAEDKEIFVGASFGRTREYSEQLSAKIDTEIHKLLDTAEKHASEIVSGNLARLQKIIDTLLAKEKITGEEFSDIMKNDPALA